MLLNQSERGSKPRRAQPVVLGDTNVRIEPELGLARLVMNVNVHPRLFPREEVEAVPSRTKDRRAHRIILHRGTGTGSPALLLGLPAGAQEHRDQRGGVAQVGGGEPTPSACAAPSLGQNPDARFAPWVLDKVSERAVTGNEDLLTNGECREGRGNSAGQDSAQPVADELLM